MLSIDGWDVVGESSPAGGPAQAAAHAAHPVRRVAHRPDQFCCLVGGVDHGNQQVLHADLQVLFDQRGVTVG